MSSGFPLSNKLKAGSNFTYDPVDNHPNIEEAVITDKNFEPAFDKIIKKVPGTGDVVSTKVSVNSHGVIVKTDDLKATDLPAHNHKEAISGGVINLTPSTQPLALTTSTVTYNVDPNIVKGIFMITLNGVEIEFTKNDSLHTIQIQSIPDRACTAVLHYLQ